MLNNKTNDEIFLYASSLVNIPSAEVAHLFKVHHIYLPDYLHNFVLRETLSKYVFDKDLYSTYTDEYKYRLRAYKNFSIFLLEKAMISYNIQPRPAEYCETFFKLFLLNSKLYGASESFFNDLEALRDKFSRAVNRETFATAMANYQKIYYTPKGYLDGLCLSVIKESLVASATLSDLHDLGLKYNVDVPRRINKGKLLEIIAARFMLNPEQVDAIKKKSVLDLEIYAKNNGFKVSTDLKKSDMVEYIIYSLQKYHQPIEQDLHNYDIRVFAPETVVTDMEEITIEVSEHAIPISNQYVEKEVEEIKRTKELEEDDYVPVEVVYEEEVVEETPVEELVEEVVEEPVQEEVVEEVAEEPVQEETPVEEVTALEEVKEVQPVADPQPTYYDPVVDEEVQKIIKKYYKTRSRQRRYIILLLLLVVAACAYVLYEMYLK